MCTCDTERPGTSQERDHLVQKGAWGLWKSTALSVCWHPCPSCAASPHTTGTRRASGIVPCSCPLSTAVIYRQASSCTHRVHKMSVCWKHHLCPVWQVQQSHCCFPSCPRSKAWYLLFPGHGLFRTGLQHQVHVLLITQYPVIIHGPSSGESLSGSEEIGHDYRSLAGRCFLWYLEKPWIWQIEQSAKHKIDAKYQTFYVHLLFSNLFEQPGWLKVSWFKDMTVQTVHWWFWAWIDVEKITVLESNWKLSSKQ